MSTLRRSESGSGLAGGGIQDDPHSGSGRHPHRGGHRRQRRLQLHQQDSSPRNTPCAFATSLGLSLRFAPEATAMLFSPLPPTPPRPRRAGRFPAALRSPLDGREHCCYHLRHHVAVRGAMTVHDQPKRTEDASPTAFKEQFARGHGPSWRREPRHGGGKVRTAVATTMSGDLSAAGEPPARRGRGPGRTIAAAEVGNSAALKVDDIGIATSLRVLDEPTPIVGKQNRPLARPRVSWKAAQMLDEVAASVSRPPPRACRTW